LNTEFICPDAVRINKYDCLRECRMSNRCLSKRTLGYIAVEREWKGCPSVTQLLSGTRQKYLEIIKDYAVDPQNLLFAMLGSGVHLMQENHTPEGDLAEDRLTLGYVNGAFDYYDSETQTLYDTKTYGSYKIAKAMGYYEKWEFTGVYVKGPKKGQNKFERRWVPGGYKDRFDLAVQLNCYRLMLENLGHPVKQMLCEVICKDGGTFMAKQRGIDRIGYLVEINRISNTWIEKYFKEKSKRLLAALEKNQLPPPCSKKESWDGRKCKGYCPVWEFCDRGREINNQKTGEEETND